MNFSKPSSIFIALSFGIVTFLRAEQSDPIAQNSQIQRSGNNGTDFENRVGSIKEEERKILTQLEAMNTELGMIKTRMGAEGRVYVRSIRSGLLPAGEGFDAFLEHAAKVERIRRNLEKDITRESQLVSQQTKLKQKLSDLRLQLAPLLLQQETIVRARDILMEAEERNTSYFHAFQNKHSTDEITLFGSNASPSSSNSLFKEQMGKLLLPISGRVTSRKIHSAHGKGIEFYSSSDAFVRCVYQGRVSFADEYEDRGLTILVDHGDQYYSIYSGLERIDAQVGEAIQTGKNMGVVGKFSDGKSGFTFEMREGRETTDPSLWFGF